MPATIDQLIRENVRIRDLLGRFVSLTQDDIIAHEGLALTVSPTIAGYHGALGPLRRSLPVAFSPR